MEHFVFCIFVTKRSLINTLRKYLLNEYTLVFFCCVAALAGPALSSLFDGSEKQFPDAASYLGLAHGDFDQSTVRRYRVIIPFLAAALDIITGGVSERLKPTYFTEEFSIRFCFLLVNLFTMALFCLLVYRYCKAFGYKGPAAICGLAAVATSRYTIYFSALPLVDSLFSVATALVLLGIKTENKKMLVLAIFLGPLSKESFIFVAPLIVFFSGIPILRQLMYFLGAGLLAWSVRIALDHYYPINATNWLIADTQHVANITGNLRLFFSGYGLYKIIVNFGLWVMIPIVAFVIRRSFLKGVFVGQYACLGLFLFFVVVQMLLSGSMERMVYPALIVFAVIVCAATQTIIEDLPKKTKAPGNSG